MPKYRKWNRYKCIRQDGRMKRVYYTIDEANEAVLSMGVHGIELGPYYCIMHSGYHIGRVS